MWSESKSKTDNSEKVETPVLPIKQNLEEKEIVDIINDVEEAELIRSPSKERENSG